MSNKLTVLTRPQDFYIKPLNTRVYQTVKLKGHLLDAIIKELGEQQDKYDAETNHSQILEKKLLRQKFIATELKKLAYYRK